MPQLHGPACPAELAYVLAWYGEVASARPAGVAGTQRVSWSDMLAWSVLTGNQPLPSEVRLMQRIDSLVVGSMNSRRKTKNA